MTKNRRFTLYYVHTVYQQILVTENFYVIIYEHYIG